MGESGTEVVLKTKLKNLAGGAGGGWERETKKEKEKKNVAFVQGARSCEDSQPERGGLGCEGAGSQGPSPFTSSTTFQRCSSSGNLDQAAESVRPLVGTQRGFGEGAEMGAPGEPRSGGREIGKGGLVQLGPAKGGHGPGTASVDRRGEHQLAPSVASSLTAGHFLAREEVSTPPLLDSL